MRFWLTSTKVESKLASTEATIARRTSEEPEAGTPGTQPRSATTQKPTQARCGETNRVLPVNQVIASTIRSSTVAAFFFALGPGLQRPDVALEDRAEAGGLRRRMNRAARGAPAGTASRSKHCAKHFPQPPWSTGRPHRHNLTQSEEL